MPEIVAEPRRERIDDRQVFERLTANGSLVIDNRRSRPLYFDGRFLAARDLTREQNYFLTRQADLGRAGGAGVVAGLMVSQATDAGGTTPTAGSLLQITAGHGVTGAGELVILEQTLTLDLANVAEIQRLDGAFGLAPIPREPVRNRTGLFVVALRPVEYTANPLAAYPTSITRPRSVEDGDIIEATAVVLVPFADAGVVTDQPLRRAQVARAVFVQGSGQSLGGEVLPLAVVALERSVVRWVDPFLVRREVGAEHFDILGLGFAPRAQREAHLLQYDRHLRDVIRERGGQGGRFAASDYFLALPPAGRLPAAAINQSNFSQTYFPAEVDVELAIIPDDEIPAMLEESLLLPPIDLTLTGDEQEATAVMVLVSVPRANLSTARATLTQQGSPLTRPFLPAAPGLIARRRPLEILQQIRLPRLPPLPPQGNPVDDAWRTAIQQAADANVGYLWYMRRRNLSYREDLAGKAVQL